MGLSQLKEVVGEQLQAIREGLLWILPCLMLISLILLVASIGEFIVGPDTPWVVTLNELYQFLKDLFPLLLTAALAYILAMKWRLPRPPVALVSIVYLTLFQKIFDYSDSVQVLELVISVLTPLYSIPLLAYCYQKRVFTIAYSRHIGRIVKESLNMILPSIAVGLVVISLNALIVVGVDALKLDSIWHLEYKDAPLLFASMFAVANSLLWFVGIHGYYALLPWIETLQHAVSIADVELLSSGITSSAVNYSFMGAFSFIGGAGATLGLVFALLIFSKNRAHRLVAIASLPLSFFNINEVLLFGLPIIFNLRLLLPFICAPLVNTLIAYWFVSSGYVSIPTAIVPFNSPVFINAFIVTEGDISASLLQIFLVCTSAALYIPSVLKMNRDVENKTIHMTSFDTTYSRRQEEASLLMDDRVQRAANSRKEQQRLERQLETFSSREFTLEYQPQICHVTKRVCGYEALIRAIDTEGNIQNPGAFLPWFEKAGLMKDIDLWAINRAVEDLQRLSKSGLLHPISVNLTPDTLVDHELMVKITEIIKPVANQIHIEITEESLLKDKATVTESIAALHSVGAKVYIDDFGSGFSSLSYLTLFDIDAIKIDRSFIKTIENEKGRCVLNGLINVATELHLSIVIEGVETKDQLSWIPELDHITIQGWIYSKSLPCNQLVSYVESMQPAQTVQALAQN